MSNLDNTMPMIDAEQIEATIDYGELVNKLKLAFKEEYQVPQRHHYSYSPSDEDEDSTLLLMPAWDKGHDLGIKLITVTPNNSQIGLPTIQGVYILFDQVSGSPKAILDAKILTTKRTAATSALASEYLSRSDSKSMLMIGTGAMAPELVKAHASVRPIERVYVWGRNFDKTLLVCDQLIGSNITVEPVRSYDEIISKVDIISCATLSTDPLIMGEAITPGQHIDLVGSYKPEMRESDDVLAAKASWFVDGYEGATKESGDLIIPMKKGILAFDDIKADLFELCGDIKKGRTAEDEITCFKSVGHALEDLVAAALVFDHLQNE